VMQRISIRSISATPVSVPTKRALVTRAHIFQSVPLILVDIETNEGITGRAYSFCYSQSVAKSSMVEVDELSRILGGQAVAPLELSGLMSRYFKLCSLTGPLLMVASAIDVAAWDVLAISANLPLSILLGAEQRSGPAYNSCGLGLITADAAADEAEELLFGGFCAVKMRLGRSSFGDDLAAVRAVRKRLPDDIALMVDYNQALTFAQAMQYCPAFDDEGIFWIEEPIRHDDYEHAALVARASKTPIQLGENCVGTRAIRDALKAVASDYLMFDQDRIGGVTGWRHAAGLASAYDREVSTHLLPEVSAHLIASTPTRQWLEYVDWADPILQEPLKIVDGMAVIADLAGNGLRWDTDAVEKYRMD